MTSSYPQHADNAASNRMVKWIPLAFGSLAPFLGLLVLVLYSTIRSGNPVAMLDSAVYVLAIGMCASCWPRWRRSRRRSTEFAVIIAAVCAAVVTSAYRGGHEGPVATLAASQIDAVGWTFLMIVIAGGLARWLDCYTHLLIRRSRQTRAQPRESAPSAGNVPVFAQMASLNKVPPATGSIHQQDPVEEMRQRLAALEEKVAFANASLDRLRGRGRIGQDTADAASKMQGYLDGAARLLRKREIARAKHFADWADYEASLVLAAGM